MYASVHLRYPESPERIECDGLRRKKRRVVVHDSKGVEEWD
jgi:hypothetical protein